MPIGNRSRRKALKMFGTVAMGGILSLGAIPVQGTKAVSRPVRARGMRTIRRIPQENGYIREVEFKIEETNPISVNSKDESIIMSTESGNYNPEVRPGNTVDFGKDELKIDKEMFKDTEQAVKSQRSGKDEPDVIEYKDTAILGTVEQHYAQEMRMRDALLAADSISSQAESNPLLAADCSKYTYNGDNPSDRDDLAERTAPINLAWDNGKDASDIQDEMQDEGWGSPWPSSDKYIFEDEDTVKAQDEHIKRNIPPSSVPTQYHVRAYDLSGVDNLEIVGAGHRDPPDHNQGCEWVGIGCGVNWRVSETRGEVSDEWTDVKTKYAGNANMDSASGNYDYIEGDIKDDGDSIGCPPFCPV
ncbi:hypothetical protein [Natrinema ejinorense]|nr:hypothetical protein [Natrinema ejinorense]